MNDKKITHDEAMEDLRFIAENITAKQWKILTSRIENIRGFINQQEDQSIELEEYKISDKSKEESSIEYYNLYKDTKRRLEKVSKLLELYRLSQSWIFANSGEWKVLNNQIKALEEELK